MKNEWLVKLVGNMTYIKNNIYVMIYKIKRQCKVIYEKMDYENII